MTGLGVGLLATGSLGLRAGLPPVRVSVWLVLALSPPRPRRLPLRASVERRFGKSELTLRIEQRRDASYTVTRCLFCQGRIIHRGAAAEGRAAADLHRQAKHPGIASQQRRRVVKTHRGAAAAAAG